MIKQPNQTMKSNKDWTEIDLEAIGPDFIPATAYQPNDKERARYESDYGSWDFSGRTVAVSRLFRVAWRQMAASTGFRTLYTALIPPGAKHVHGVNSSGTKNSNYLVQYLATSSSILSDFFIRSTGIAFLTGNVINQLPYSLLPEEPLKTCLRLNCLTSVYAPLWEEITGEEWTVDTPIRSAEERFYAQNEINAIVALSLGVTADELCMIYRTQFPVMRRYDQEDLYDANGRKVPKDIMKLQNKLKDSEELSEEQRTWVHPQSEATYVFEYPFRVLDREADLRAAYAKFERQLKES